MFGFIKLHYLRLHLVIPNQQKHGGGNSQGTSIANYLQTAHQFLFGRKFELDGDIVLLCDVVEQLVCISHHELRTWGEHWAGHVGLLQQHKPHIYLICALTAAQLKTGQGNQLVNTVILHPSIWLKKEPSVCCTQTKMQERKLSGMNI